MSKERSTPASERQKYGGQAVVEGVMMRSPRYFAVACRRQSTGEIVVERENVESITKGWQWLNKPFLRGTLALVDAFYMGTKALMYSANVQASDMDAIQDPKTVRTEANAAGAVNLAIGEGVAAPVGSGIATVAPAGTPPINGIVIGGTVVASILIGMGLFWAIPTAITQVIQHHFGLIHPNRLHQFYLNLSDGLIRIVIFLLYITLISQMANVKRVFQYHGAEHKAINTLEAMLPLTLENARAASRLHPRCGTNFIFIVLITSIFVFSAFGRPPQIWERIPLHLLLLPIVAGISFEVLKFAGKYRDQKWASLLIAPGLATQYLTTRVPDDSQLEVALAALDSVWEKEHEAPVDAAAEPVALERVQAVA